MRLLLSSIESEQPAKKVLLQKTLNKFFRQVHNVPFSTHLSKRWLQRRLKTQVERCRRALDPLRVVVGATQLWPVIGAPTTSYSGWLTTDIASLDILDPKDWNSVFPVESIDKILAEHVFEHLTAEQFRAFLRVVQVFLSPRGSVRVAVPDGFHPDPAYIEYVRPGGSGPGAHDHKVLYDYLEFTRILAEEGWEYVLLEYFDEQGEFHRTKWSEADGFVGRSAAYDSRNKERPLSYTSLIVDFRPKGESRKAG